MPLPICFSQLPITRRAAIAGTVGAVGVACSRNPAPGSEPLVSIVRVSAYSQNLYDTVRRIVGEHKLDVRGKRVVLKPNLVEFDPATVINTHPLVVHAALEAFRSLGAADVRVAEGPGHRRITFDLAEAAGYFRTIPNFEDLFTDLNLDEVAFVRIPGSFSKLDSLYLPKTALSCDLLVSMPKMKTHHWVGATLAMKNLFGLVPGGVYGWPKNILHWAGISECIADIHRLIPSHFCLVDGIVGMEGNGPIQGTPKHAGLLVAGKDMTAVDSTCCRLMGIDPEKIGYLKMAETVGQTTAANVRQIGEQIKPSASPFTLISQFAPIRLRASR